MNVIVVEQPAFATVSAELLARTIREKPTATLAVAAGRTLLSTYQALAHFRNEQGLDTSQLRIFQLQAYVGISQDDRRSLYRWLQEFFCEPLGIAASQIVRLPGNATDIAQACATYNDTVKSVGGFDLAILGLGVNGIVGFNEPPSPCDATTRLVELTETSRIVGASYWNKPVPAQALTCGMDLLLNARQTMLLVSGCYKHSILERVTNGSPSPDVPASLLRHASHVTVVADDEAWCGK